jgi:hypothetical protein
MTGLEDTCDRFEETALTESVTELLFGSLNSTVVFGITMGAGSTKDGRVECRDRPEAERSCKLRIDEVRSIIRSSLLAECTVDIRRE